MSEIKPQTTVSLAKGLHLTLFAAEYYKDVIRQEKLSGHAKNTVNGWVNRLEWVIRDVYTNMQPHAAELLKTELQKRDIASVESILNMVIMLDEDERLAIEDYITKNYINGKAKQ